jgi:hypothetical protein
MRILGSPVERTLVSSEKGVAGVGCALSKCLGLAHRLDRSSRRLALGGCDLVAIGRVCNGAILCVYGRSPDGSTGPVSGAC